MRNFHCSKYETCLIKAAREDAGDLSCENCPDRTELNTDKLPEMKAMIALLTAVYPLQRDTKRN